MNLLLNRLQLIAILILIENLYQFRLRRNDRSDTAVPFPYRDRAFLHLNYMSKNNQAIVGRWENPPEYTI